ncbi:MAG TPA: MFS transporter [Xanthobacteraceae bacterium]|nr:MFS transporter [Xanthobacteraceae bacterium]
MLELLERQQILTKNQRRIVFAAILGDGLEFFDYFVIGFVLAFIVGPWKLTYGESAVILLSSGIGAMIGAYVWGWAADRIGRRKVFIATVLNFSLASGVLALTPEGGWLFLSIFRFFVGFGVGGLYCVDLPLVQEFMPTSKRGRIGGIVTAAIPLGTLLGALLGGYLAPVVGWRGLFVVGLFPAALTLLIRAWVPESPRWLIRMGRFEEARKSLAWALEMDPNQIDLTTVRSEPRQAAWSELFKHPRSLFVSWLGNLGTQTGIYGLTLWVPTLFVQILGVTPPQASRLMIAVTLGGFVGRLSFSYLSDAIGRRASGGLLGLGAAVMLVLTAYLHDVFIGTASLFWLLTIAAYFFADGGFAIVGPYAAEVWPAGLRTSGMGSAYGFGGLGKIIGPLGLALIVGSSNVVTPQASVAMIGPAFLYLAGWYLLAGIVYYFVGIETKGRSIESIDGELARPVDARRTVAT